MPVSSQPQILFPLFSREHQSTGSHWRGVLP
uniref:Uncharacterized protein n=1 Tax=Anguilla anguilla TaxID=7936 RepID=A0A0E9P6M4_ANGAN